VVGVLRSHQQKVRLRRSGKFAATAATML
jgi:hypothetical protein